MRRIRLVIRRVEVRQAAFATGIGLAFQPRWLSKPLETDTHAETSATRDESTDVKLRGDLIRVAADAVSRFLACLAQILAAGLAPLTVALWYLNHARSDLLVLLWGCPGAYASRR